MSDPKAAERLKQWQVQPGQVLNRGGMPRGYRNPSAVLRLLLAERMTVADLERVADTNRVGGRVHPMRVALARELLAACADRQRWAIDRTGVAYSAGLDPEPGRALARVMDRLEGTPVRRVDLETHTRPRTAAEVVADIGRLLAGNPALAAVVALRAGGGALAGATDPGEPLANPSGRERGDRSDATDSSTATTSDGPAPPAPPPPLRGTDLVISDLRPSSDSLRAKIEDGETIMMKPLIEDVLEPLVPRGSRDWGPNGMSPMGDTGIEDSQGVSDDETGQDRDTAGVDPNGDESGQGGSGEVADHREGELGGAGRGDGVSDGSGDDCGVSTEGQRGEAELSGSVGCEAGDDGTDGREGCRVVRPEVGRGGGGAGDPDELDRVIGIEDPTEDE